MTISPATWPYGALPLKKPTSSEEGVQTWQSYSSEKHGKGGFLFLPLIP